jgi:serine/threonine protein kinase
MLPFSSLQGHFAAPEILEGGGYGKGVDWWSFGTLMFEMLTGLPPFYSQDVQQMYSKIMTAKVKYPEHISENAKDLLQKVFIFLSIFLIIFSNVDYVVAPDSRS